MKFMLRQQGFPIKREKALARLHDERFQFAPSALGSYESLEDDSESEPSSSACRIGQADDRTRQEREGTVCSGRVASNVRGTTADTAWRQKISRLYYAVYNFRRSVVLRDSGRFSTEPSDHNNVEQLPEGVEHRESHVLKLRSLREDRNLADYSHQAVITDLVISPADALVFANTFHSDCRSFLLSKHGLTV